MNDRQTDEQYVISRIIQEFTNTITDLYQSKSEEGIDLIIRMQMDSLSFLVRCFDIIPL